MIYGSPECPVPWVIWYIEFNSSTTLRSLILITAISNLVNTNFTTLEALSEYNTLPGGGNNFALFFFRIFIVQRNRWIISKENEWRGENLTTDSRFFFFFFNIQFISDTWDMNEIQRFSFLKFVKLKKSLFIYF